MTSRISIVPAIVCAAMLGAHPAHALDVPRPTVNIPRPTISVPRPTVNIARPTISVPHPTVNVARPTVSVPHASVPQVSAPKIDAHKADVPNLNNAHAPSKAVTNSTPSETAKSTSPASTNAAAVKTNSSGAMTAPTNSPAPSKAVANAPAAPAAAGSSGPWTHDISPKGWTHVNGGIVYLDGHWHSVPAPPGDPGPSAAVRNSPVLWQPDASSAAPASARASPLGSPVITPKVETAGPAVTPSMPRLSSRDMTGASEMRPYSPSDSGGSGAAPQTQPPQKQSSMGQYPDYDGASVDRLLDVNSAFYHTAELSISLPDPTPREPGLYASTGPMVPIESLDHNPLNDFVDASCPWCPPAPSPAQLYKNATTDPDYTLLNLLFFGLELAQPEVMVFGLAVDTPILTGAAMYLISGDKMAALSALAGIGLPSARARFDSPGHGFMSRDSAWTVGKEILPDLVSKTPFGSVSSAQLSLKPDTPPGSMAGAPAAAAPSSNSSSPPASTSTGKATETSTATSTDQGN
jgi:hypothetical protein